MWKTEPVQLGNAAGDCMNMVKTLAVECLQEWVVSAGEDGRGEEGLREGDVGKREC